MISKNKRTKKTTVTSVRKKAWAEFSRFIRLRDAARYGAHGYVPCATCGTTKHWKEQQAGHFIPQAQGNAVRFDEKNVNTQCYRCNINLGGNGPEYYPFMVAKYGEDVIDDLKRRAKTTKKFTVTELEEMRITYRDKAAELEAEI